MTLDVGEDRLVVEARRAGIVLDVFVPYSMDGEAAAARFHRDQRRLYVDLPLCSMK